MRWLYRHLIFLLRYAFWLLSELEAHLSEPGDPILLRKVFLWCNGIKPPSKLWIGRGFILHKGYGPIYLNENCALGDNVVIASHSSITIGIGFIGASGLHIDSGSHDPETLLPLNKPVFIGDYVWCGVQSTILSGAKIDDHCVIAAGSVVASHMRSFTLAAGVPARPKRTLTRDARNLWTW